MFKGYFRKQLSLGSNELGGRDFIYFILLEGISHKEDCTGSIFFHNMSAPGPKLLSTGRLIVFFMNDIYK